MPRDLGGTDGGGRAFGHDEIGEFTAPSFNRRIVAAPRWTALPRTGNAGDTSQIVPIRDSSVLEKAFRATPCPRSDAARDSDWMETCLS
jgi:hypothetical protein